MAKAGREPSAAGQGTLAMVWRGQAAEDCSLPLPFFPPGWMKSNSFSWQRRASMLPGYHRSALLTHFFSPPAHPSPLLAPAMAAGKGQALPANDVVVCGE